MDLDAPAQSGTVLTIEHLQAAVARIRNACPTCGGNGEVIAEGSQDFHERLMLTLEVQGFLTVGDTLIRMRECPMCSGSGRR